MEEKMELKAFYHTLYLLQLESAPTVNPIRFIESLVHNTRVLQNRDPDYLSTDEIISRFSRTNDMLADFKIDFSSTGK